MKTSYFLKGYMVGCIVMTIIFLFITIINKYESNKKELEIIKLKTEKLCN